MDAELKSKWIAALRSGEYEQARTQLRDREKYCCLGVLCEVAGLTISSDGIGLLRSDGNQVGYQAIWDLAGSEHHCRKLAGYNDQGKPFSEIALYIERNL